MFQNENKLVLDWIYPLFKSEYLNEISETNVSRAKTAISNFVYIIVNLPIIAFTSAMYFETRLQKNVVTSKALISLNKNAMIVFTIFSLLFPSIILYLLSLGQNIILQITAIVVGLIIQAIVTVNMKRNTEAEIVENVKHLDEIIEKIMEEDNTFETKRIKVEACLTIKKFFSDSIQRKINLTGIIAIFFLASKLSYKSELKILESETRQAISIISH